MRRVVGVFIASLFILQISFSALGQDTEEIPASCALQFDGDLANQSVHYQTDLGPRIPGSAASSELRESIKSNL